MSALTIAGGVYHERCTWPEWNRVLGSGGRAAAAVAGHVEAVVLHTYAAPDALAAFRPQADLDQVDVHAESVQDTVSFEYVHSLSTPTIVPSPSRISRHSPLTVEANVVLRFGMMEGSARVVADRCVYDPQSAFAPERFGDNGSRSEHLAIVGNRGEIASLGGASDPLASATNLLRTGAEVVVVKSGPVGAFVVTTSGTVAVPPHRSSRVWTLGSGDVFAAAFALHWGIHQVAPLEAAKLASIAVSAYAETMALPILGIGALAARAAPVHSVGGLVYLAAPFFTIGQRWLVDEARRCLRDLGLTVFSPVHDVGAGPAEVIGPADIAGLDQCDLVFAILDGLDSGTLFEVGYARARGKPVYALAQNVSVEDMKMIVGSGCGVHDDFVTALHHLSWRA